MQPRLGDVAFHIVQVEEAFVAAGALRYGFRRQQAVKFHGHGQRIAHDPLGRARVDIDAVQDDISIGGVEILKFQLAQGAAVHGIAILAAQPRDIKPAGALADLLIRCDDDADLAVGALTGP